MECTKRDVFLEKKNSDMRKAYCKLFCINMLAGVGLK